MAIPGQNPSMPAPAVPKVPLSQRAATEARRIGRTQISLGPFLLGYALGLLTLVIALVTR